MRRPPKVAGTRVFVLPGRRSLFWGRRTRCPIINASHGTPEGSEQRPPHLHRFQPVSGMYDNATGGEFRGCGYNLGGLSDGWHHVVAVATSDRKPVSSEVYAVGNYQGGSQRFADKIDEVR